MQTKGLVVDLRGLGKRQLQSEFSEEELSHFSFIESAQQLEIEISANTAAALLIHASHWNDELTLVLTEYARLQGASPAFMTLICDDPSSELMLGAFQFGVDQVMSFEGWSAHARKLLQRVQTLIEGKHAEYHVIRVNQAIASSRQNLVQEALEEIGPSAEYDFLSAYATGLARAALGSFQSAINAFDVSQKINPHYIPALAALAENRLILNQTNDALKVLLHMESCFSKDLNHKALLVCAALLNNNEAAATAYLHEAEAISKSHPRVVEARVQVLLSQGKLQDALLQIDNITNAGVLFASRLNETGIHLSQTKQGKAALELYEKAHRIVKPELRYKISLNAALAAHRLGDSELALRHLDNVQKEFGATFPKLEKIRSAVEKKAGRGADVV